MAAFLVDESCPRAVAEALRAAGHDIRYAADTDRRALDTELVALAQAEQRVIVTEDFDFGELLIRRQLRAPGAIVLFLPKSSPDERASRLIEAMATAGSKRQDGFPLFRHEEYVNALWRAIDVWPSERSTPIVALRVNASGR